MQLSIFNGNLQISWEWYEQFLSVNQEFWYVTQDKNYLTLELNNESFKRIILTIDNHQDWAERINLSIQSSETPS